MRWEQNEVEQVALFELCVSRNLTTTTTAPNRASFVRRRGGARARQVELADVGQVKCNRQIARLESAALGETQFCVESHTARTQLRARATCCADWPFRAHKRSPVDGAEPMCAVPSQAERGSTWALQSHSNRCQYEPSKLKRERASWRQAREAMCM